MDKELWKQTSNINAIKVFSNGMLPCPVSWFIWGRSPTSSGLKFKEMVRNNYGQGIMKTNKKH